MGVTVRRITALNTQSVCSEHHAQRSGATAQAVEQSSAVRADLQACDGVVHVLLLLVGGLGLLVGCLTARVKSLVSSIQLGLGLLQLLSALC